MGHGLQRTFLFYRGTFIVLSEADAGFYDRHGTLMASMPFWDGVELFLNSNSIADLGMVVVVSTVYRFIESNLALNVMYIVIGVLSVRNMVSLARNFMDGRYSFLCALTFSCSSFLVWFNVSGLKESLLVYLFILVLERYYKYRQNKNITIFLTMSLTLVAIGFFRPLISIFLITSFGLTYL